MAKNINVHLSMATKPNKYKKGRSRARKMAISDMMKPTICSLGHPGRFFKKAISAEDAFRLPRYHI
jgi:hypothetical protein